MKTLQECDFVTAANLLGCEVAAIKAVDQVESNGSGFLPSGKPKILFERHYFHKLTAGKYSATHSHISNSKPGNYGASGEHQHDRLEEAAKLNRNAALESTSWGRYQIMGANWDELGYKSLQEFINAMYASETEQLMAFVKFVKVNNLVQAIRRKDWATFAKGYNGRNYAINKYDTKLAAAYAKFSKQ